jgi:hypothetical protein
MTDRPASSQPPSTDDPAVEEEWRRIERERIAEEVEEAREDAIVEKTPSRRRWPWLAFAAALVAGMIAALVLNSPSAVSRRTALPPPEPVATAGPQPAGPQGATSPEESGPSPESLEE